MTAQRNPKPPRLATKLLESLCSYDYLSTALWDMEELFQFNVEKKGLAKAKWLYVKEALSIIFHLYFKGQSQYSLNTTAMLKNNIILAFRNFKRHKNYTFLNVLGLSTGLMIFLLITLFTTFEFSYDDYHENANRIFRVYKKINVLEELYYDAGTPGLLAETLVAEFPEVEETSRFIKLRNQLVEVGNDSYVEPAVFAADPSVFKIFSLEFLHGSKDEMLQTGKTVAISERIAMKYFGKTDVINEVLHRRGTPYVIKSVFKNMRVNTHFPMDLIIDFETATEGDNLANWNNNPYFTYILLKQGADADKLEAMLPAIREKYANDPIDEDGQAVTYYLEPLPEVHFSTHINWGLADTSDAGRLYAFQMIAFIVLLMASINYINLATARAMVRVKETGIRKIVGARRSSLLKQFLIESGLLVFFSLILAVLCAQAVLPFFAQFVDRPLAFNFSSSVFWFSLIGLGTLITLLSGLYPALVMSSFNPLHAVTSRGNSKQGGFLRNGLVVLQFALSTILIISAIVWQNQLSFIDNLDTGYTRDQVMVLSTRDDVFDDKLDEYMEELRKVPGVEVVATSWSLPTNVTSNTQANWPGISDAQRIQMYMLGVTYDFFDLYEIKIQEGRTFNRQIQSDKNAIVLNEAAVNSFGWESPIGREMILQNGESGTVIGVVKDFNIKSLKEKIEPLQIVLNPDYARLALRISGDAKSTMLAVEEVYDSFEPSYPFEYRFFEDIYNQAYEDDTKTGQLTIIFSMLAIIIACLGLYGLASHKVALRIKELGVRKVMGASAFNIASLLFKDFLLLIGIAFFVAGPIAFFLLQNWLENYAYHIDLNIVPFLITLTLLIVFAAITIGYRTIKASITSPVLALRDE